MGQLGNDINLENEIAFATEIPSVKLASIGVHTNVKPPMQSIAGQMVQVYVTPSSADLELRYFIDQLDKRPMIIIAMELEAKIARFSAEVHAMFVNRNVHEDYNGTKIIDYTLKLHGYDDFMDSLQRLARKRVDRDFTIALEAKLSED